ncbi:hypothetical protein L6164_011018 [Bauhinia variegata]|uniref:Uncharacterized protein n=1 Tax=Bauhinia variegata TaxID=167791 RepID=A0ACB9P9S3_BAUVA|nr:hypothetical protein L6164_011018 [Bauhinia variegata]
MGTMRPPLVMLKSRAADCIFFYVMSVAGDVEDNATEYLDVELRECLTMENPMLLLGCEFCAFKVIEYGLCYSVKFKVLEVEALVLHHEADSSLPTQTQSLLLCKSPQCAYLIQTPLTIKVFEL